MKGGLEQRDAESLALARQHERVRKRVEIGNDPVWGFHPERIQEVDARDPLRKGFELGEVADVRRVVRSRWSRHDQHRGATPSAERRRRGHGGLDALAPREPGRQHEQRVGAVEVEALGHARAGRRHSERGGEGGELIRALVGHGDVANARMRARDEAPRIAWVAFVRVLGVRPCEVVRPRDDDPRPLAGEPDERFRQRQILVHREDVVNDDAVGFGHDRSQLAHESFDERVVRCGAFALRERAEVTEHALVP